MPSFFSHWDTPIFQDTSGWGMAFLLVLYFCAYTVKGVFGIGAMPLIVLLGSWVLPPHQAVLVAMLVLTYNQVMFVPESFRYGDWRLCGLLSIGYVPTVAWGVWFFDHLNQSCLDIVLGVLLISVILADAIISPKKFRSVSERFPTSGPLIMAAVTGLISGIVGAGSLIFLSLYLKNLYRDPRTFRATILLVSVLISIWRFAVQYFKGMITVPLLSESFILAPAAFMGAYFGIRLFKITPSATYFRFFRIILVILSLSLIIRSLIAFR